MPRTRNTKDGTSRTAKARASANPQRKIKKENEKKTKYAGQLNGMGKNLFYLIGEANEKNNIKRLINIIRKYLISGKG